MRTGGKGFSGFASLFLSLWVAILSSCARYSLGPVGVPPFRTLYVEIVDNDSFAPQAGPLLSTSLREAFIRDGRVKLVRSPDLAEATFSLRLTQYKRQAASFRGDDTARANAFEIKMDGEATLTDNRQKGKSFFANRKLKGGARLVWDDPTASPTGRQSMMAAISDLSQEAVSLTLDAW